MRSVSSEDVVRWFFRNYVICAKDKKANTLAVTGAVKWRWSTCVFLST